MEIRDVAHVDEAHPEGRARRNLSLDHSAHKAQGGWVVGAEQWSKDPYGMNRCQFQSTAFVFDTRATPPLTWAM